MLISDPRLEVLEVDGQRLYAPSPEAWSDLWAAPILEAKTLPVPDLLKKKVEALAPHSELAAALGFAKQQVLFYELLTVGASRYRVFIEAVICEHCGHRATLSATPGVSEIYRGSEDESAAQERSWGLPRQSCFSCGKPLIRRPTVWQVNAAP
jgi:hypothetical protein